MAPERNQVMECMPIGSRAMRIEPLPHYRPPRYPTRAMADASPDLLRAAPPRRLGTAGALAAFGTMCLAAEGCQSRLAGDVAISAPMTRIAPVFHHGAGRTVADRSADPSAHLTDAEALAAIAEEGSAAGLKLVQEKGDSADPTRIRSVDSAHRVTVEFVSLKRAEHVLGKGARDVSTAAAAERERTAIRSSAASGTYAVFYEPEPQAKPSRNPRTQAAAIKAQERADLKAQVRDFVKWLKAQGVI